MPTVTVAFVCRESKKWSILFALSFAFSQGAMFLVYGCAFRLGAFLVTRGEDGSHQCLQYLDGMDVSAINVGYLQQCIMACEPRLSLMDHTLGENVVYGLDPSSGVPSQEELEEAARMARFHNFVSQLPLGYDTPLCNSAMTQLLEGQKQRVALARALVRKLPILVLDEATSTLDAEAEQAKPAGQVS
ncbi:multidrug resistance protein pgp-1-like isoform X2 [Dermacentor silvarum]|uniref:multidrug resistance protein pgp-1-like isoform X2 n=1 Tax=Dermacentor silvarum TaxID=543639 RepID=UPI002100A6F1|nr:multidrug resistance protein pgp-1-like isoform X2 [Dermacentor silvarum]